MDAKDREVVFFQVVLPFLIALILRISYLPWDESLALSKARMAEVNHQPAEAIKQLSQAMKFNPDRIDLWRRLAEMNVRMKDYPAAIQAYREIELRNAMTTGDVLALANAHVAVNDINRAIDLWNQLWQVPSPPEEAYRNVYEVYLHAGQFSKAAAALEQWLKTYPQRPDLAFDLGVIYFVENPSRAWPVFDQAARLSPVYGALVETIKHKSLLSFQTPDEGYRLVLAGRILGNIGRWDLAYWAFKQAVAQNPDYPTAWAFLGEASQRQGQDGLPYLEKALQLDPHSHIAQALMGIYWNRQGRSEMAYIFLSSIVEEEPDQAIWHAEFANVLTGLGNFDQAYQHFKKAVELEPRNAEFIRILVDFCVEYNYRIVDVAIPTVREALLMFPQDAVLLDSMCWALFANGDLNSAERFCLRAIQKDEGYSRAHYHLGQVYLQMRNHPQAYTHLNRAYRSAGKNDDVRFFSERLLRRYFWGGL